MNHLVRSLGFFLLTAGWFLVLSAVVLLHDKPAFPVFGLLSFAVQALGLAMVFGRYRRE